MSGIISNKYFLFLLRLLLAFVFIFAAIEKISSPGNFSASISNYKLLPSEVINLLAIIIPWIELIAGLLLLLGISVKENSAIITTLLIVFTIAIIISLFRGLNIDCGCFGTAYGSRIGILKISENIILILSGLILTKWGSPLLALS
ncbi:MAG: MauE/DoxX family redox-associated membrane protein [Ignavibacteriaceae bacterium]|nr:MauE/DoxX family redox-associated membrane protein [Ignavibacteriaceae bacterium]